MSSPILQQANAEATQALEHPERKGLKKGLYLIPTAFTAGNILMGFLSVMATLRGFQLLALENNETNLKYAAESFNLAAIYIGWATLFDALDGRIARMTKTTTEIGIQFDSIADVLTFGIAPAVLAFAWGYGSALQHGTSLYKIGLFISFMYLMCGAFRLARFNVQASRPRPLIEGTVKVDKKHFIGLPIPPAAAVIAAVVHFSPQPFVYYGPDKAKWISLIMMLVVGLLGLLMVSTLKYTSFKSVGLGKKSIRSILLIAAIGMLIWLYSRYVLLTIALIYVLHGIVLKLVSLVGIGSSKEAEG
jgi:CDP-diacylglycerol--serine O-phosphatidyltransferase